MKGMYQYIVNLVRLYSILTSKKEESVWKKKYLERLPFQDTKMANLQRQYVKVLAGAKPGFSSG